MAEKFTFFWGGRAPNGLFSQWAPTPFEIDGVTYNCAEQYMMTEKARLFGDSATLAKIMSAVEPSDQKRYGREVKGFDKKVWDAAARDIVYKASYAKYTQNQDCYDAILATAGTTLVEASPHDTIWGIGLRSCDPRAKDRATWLGTNWLGETLTKVRDDIIAAQSGNISLSPDRVPLTNRPIVGFKGFTPGPFTPGPFEGRV